MEKKVFDILPPQGAGQQTVVRGPEPRVAKKEVSKENPTPQAKIIKQNSGSHLPKALLLIILLLAVFGLASEFVFDKAEIKIWPKINEKSLSQNIIVDAAQKNVDVALKVIPGQILQEERTVSQEFSATGETTEGQKASGKVRIYNNYSTSPQTLIKNTRLISSEGKLFKTTAKVIVPGGTYDAKGKFQSGSIDVGVLADQAGDDYNIEPSTFSIPGFVGTAKYTAFYGKSTAAMSGGMLGKVAQILKNDLDSAKETVKQKALEEIKDSLRGKMAADSVLFDGAIYQEILAASSSLPAGAIAKNFTYQIKINTKAIVFSETDLKNLAMSLITVGLMPDEKIKSDSLNLVYNFYSFDLNSNKMILETAPSAKVYSSIDENSFARNLAGKNLNDAKNLINSRPEISKVQIRLWPFWANSLPKEYNKVNFRLILD
jgi:hypothetical protein